MTSAAAICTRRSWYAMRSASRISRAPAPATGSSADGSASTAASSISRTLAAGSVS